MSQPDVELVCDSHEAFRNRELDRWLGYLHPDVEFTSLVLELEGVHRGHEGAREWWDNVVAVFPDWRPQVEDARVVGDRVLLRIRSEGAGTGSGIEVDRAIWQVAEVRNGRLASWKFFRSEQEAAAAAAMGG